MADKIKAKCLTAIGASTFSYRPGEIITLDVEVAKEWTERGMVKLLPAEPSTKKGKMV